MCVLHVVQTGQQYIVLFDSRKNWTNHVPALGGSGPAEVGRGALLEPAALGASGRLQHAEQHVALRPEELIDVEAIELAVLECPGRAVIEPSARAVRRVAGGGEPSGTGLEEGAAPSLRLILCSFIRNIRIGISRK